MTSPDRTQPILVAPIVKVRVVDLPPEQAFELFTARMGEWWPLRSHSIAENRAVGIRFEGHVGGRVVEVTADGQEHSWGEVEVFEPPQRFVMSWHPSLAPVAASTLEVRFDAVAGGTRVTLEHRDWERFGDAATDLRARYDSGWEPVLDRYTRAG